MAELTPRQRAHLKGLAHHLNPVVHIGKDGLSDAVKAAGGEVRDTDAPGQAKQRSAWLDARLADASVAFTAAARRRIAEQVGEDVSRVGGLVAVTGGVERPYWVLMATPLPTRST